MSGAKHLSLLSHVRLSLEIVRRVIVRLLLRPCDAGGLVVAASLALTVDAYPVRAQDAGDAIGGVFEALRLRETPRPPADFVQRARGDPARLDYQPLADAPAPATKKKKAAELEALVEDLDRARARNQRAARDIKALDAPARAPAR